MGTNFYWLGMGDDTPSDDLDPEQHIGKRSAAGLWCWDCDETMHKGGRERVHMDARPDYYAACPTCGGTFDNARASLDRGPVAVELGFAEPETVRPTGVEGCSSFTWAQDPEAAGVRCRQAADVEIVADEYGRRMTGGAFLRMLEANCPLQFTNMIGRWFT